MSATNLHALTLHQGLMTIQVFLHRKYIPTSTNFSKLFLNSFSEKVLSLNFFSSPLYHPPSLPAVYSLPLYSHCQCHSLLRNLFYICIKFNNKSMILARCTGGVMWWFHCRACARLRCLSSIVVVPLSLSGALLLVWGSRVNPLA